MQLPSLLQTRHLLESIIATVVPVDALASQSAATKPMNHSKKERIISSNTTSNATGNPIIYATTNKTTIVSESGLSTSIKPTIVPIDALASRSSATEPMNHSRNERFITSNATSNATNNTILYATPNKTTIVSESGITTSIKPNRTTHHDRAVPPRLIFTFHKNLWKTNTNNQGDALTGFTPVEQVLAQNVRDTVDKYRSFDHHSADSYGVVFLTDRECREVVRSAKPDLVPYFDSETVGKFRSDICRIAELYTNGGYYFDIDLQVIQEPFLVPKRIGFSTIWETTDYGASGFFQAFVAGAKQHPILEHALEAMLTYYQEKENGVLKTGNMGPITLKMAYDKYVAEQRLRNVNVTSGVDQTVLLLREDRFNDELQRRYHHVEPQKPSKRDSGWGCNYIVHDGKKPFFFSRVKGAKRTNIDGPGCWRR